MKYGNGCSEMGEKGTDLTYDGKFRALAVHVSEAEIDRRARELCERYDSPELFSASIRAVFYVPRSDERRDRRATLTSVLGAIAGFVVLSLLVVLGIFKLGEIVVELFLQP